MDELYRAGRLPVPQTDDPLKTQRQDLNTKVAILATQVVHMCAEDGDTPEGLELFDWRQYPASYEDGRPVQLMVDAEPDPQGGPGDHLVTMVEIGPLIQGKIDMVDHAGVRHVLDWRLGWNKVHRIGVIWIGPKRIGEI